VSNSNGPLAGDQVVAFLASTDLVRSRAFFGDNLGLPVIAEDGFACVFQAGPVELRVSLVEQVVAAPYTALGWTVEDILAAIGALTEKGVVFERFDRIAQEDAAVWSAPGGALVAWFRDPDGNLLSLTQPAQIGSGRVR
jgi:catechol 2,3-dioxygenase-like lactoylglutathione lyase family enzyme